MMPLPLPQVEMFPNVGRQEAADTVVGEEHIKVPQEAPFGFVRFVLSLQELVWNYLFHTDTLWANMQTTEVLTPIKNWEITLSRSAITSRLSDVLLYWWIPLWCFWLLFPLEASCKTSGSVLASCWAHPWWRGKLLPCQSAGHGAKDCGQDEELL